MREKTLHAYSGFILGVTGIIIIWCQTNFWISLGVFIAMWGNNLSEYSKTFK